MNSSLLCFRKFPVAEKFMDKRREGESRLSTDNFCLPVPKNFVGESFTVSLVRVSKNVRDNSGDGNHDFLSKLFSLTVSNQFIEEPFSVVFH